MKLLSILLLYITFCNTALSQNINNIISAAMPPIQKADTLLKIANAFRNRNKEDSSKIILALAEPFVNNAHEPGLYIKYHQYNGLLYLARKQDKQMIAELKKGLPYFTKATNYNIQANTLYFIGTGYSRLKQYDSAQQYFALSEKMYDRFNPYLKWIIKSEKAIMFQEADNNDLAEQYYVEAYEMTKAKGIRMDYGVMLNYLMSFYNYANKPDKYAEIKAELLAFKKQRSPSGNTSMAVHMVDLGDLDSKPLAEKIIFLEAAKKKLLALGDTTNAAFTNSAVSAAYEKNNQPQLALPYMKENMALTKGLLNSVAHFTYSKATYRLLLKLGKTEEAAALFDYILALKDSISSNEKNKQLLQLETIYQTEKKQQEIFVLSSNKKLNEKQIELLQIKHQNDSILLLKENEKQKALFKENRLKAMTLLQQQKNFSLLATQNTLMDSIVKSEQAFSALLRSENKLKQEQLAKQHELKNSIAREFNLQKAQLQKEKQIKWGLITGSLLLLMAGALIFKFYQKQKSKNIIIQKQASDLEVLMKEIHHRVKNNLQVVSSLLDLQSHSITDTQAHEAVKEGKNRVQSMALIHQNLYSEGNIKGIRIKEYVSNLVQTLCQSYNISNDAVKITASIDDLNLDVDTMIPIGLVLNELISNSFKYAFKENQNGELTILLKEQANLLHLMVSDNGKGFPDGLDVKNSASFGLKMIRAFSQKLKATLDIYNDNGAVVTMKIAKFKSA